MTKAEEAYADLPQDDRMMNLNDVSELIKTHPRTILRALMDKHNTYWSPALDFPISLNAVAQAFNINMDVINSVLNNDELLTPGEAAEFVGIPERTFRYRQYPAAIRRGGVVRFSRQEIDDYDFLNYRM